MKEVPGLPWPADPVAFAEDLQIMLAHLLSLGGCSTEPAELGAKGEWLAARLAEQGFKVKREAGEFAPHLAADTPACQESGFTLLAGHYDTVYPPSSTGYRLQCADGRGMGPTVADMSGGLVVILGALALLGGAQVVKNMPLRILINSDEERGSPSSLEFFNHHAVGAMRALVFEGGRDGDGVVLGRRGRVGLRLVVHGREAHAGIDPEHGINALAEAASLITQLEQTARVAGATLVLGGMVEVKPGVANTVPGKAVLSGDLRFDDMQVVEPLMEKLTGKLGETPARLAGVELPPNLLERVSGRPAWQPSQGDRKLFAQYADVAHCLGLTIRPLFASGGSDANLLAELGLPVIDGLGPVGKGFHRPDESIELRTLLERTVLAAAFLQKMATV